MRICARFHKGKAVCFISHLDVLRLIQRAMRRAKLPVCYSQGFNPHPLLSFATALSVGYTSDAEWLDVKLCNELLPQDFLTQLNEALPKGLLIVEAVTAQEGLPSLSALMRQADYEVKLEVACDKEKLQERIDALLSGPINVEKHTKAGIKNVDIRPMVINLEIANDEVKQGGYLYTLRAQGVLNASGGLNMELLLRALLGEYHTQSIYAVHRTSIRFDGIGV